MADHATCDLFADGSQKITRLNMCPYPAACSVVACVLTICVLDATCQCWFVDGRYRDHQQLMDVGLLAYPAYY